MQTPQAVNTIALVLGLGTIVVLIAGIAVSLRFRLDPRTHGILMKEIERLRAADPTPPPPENKAIVEDLSDWRYDQLWGRNPVAGPAR